MSLRLFPAFILEVSKLRTDFYLHNSTHQRWWQVRKAHEKASEAMRWKLRFLERATYETKNGKRRDRIRR